MTAGDDQRIKFLLGVDVGPALILPSAQRATCGHLHVHAKSLAVTGEAAHCAEALVLVTAFQVVGTANPHGDLGSCEAGLSVSAGPEPLQKIATVAFCLDQHKTPGAPLVKISIHDYDQLALCAIRPRSRY